MYLTREEERILNGEMGEVYQKALQTIVKVGEALGADRLIDISHAHVSGVSYYNLGDAGYRFIEWLYLSGAKVKIFSTLNPIGMDLDLWDKMNIDVHFTERQRKIVEMFMSMGFEESLTCTPYLIREPKRGEHLAWSESSAVGMANTYYGAYTNREAGPLSLFSSLTGKTYYAGLHRPEERVPTVKVELDVDERFAYDEGVASAVGYIVGERIRGGIPYISCKYRPTFSAVKAYAAAAGAAGNIALTYIERVTPNYHEFMNLNLERVFIERKEVLNIIERADEEWSSVDAVFVGCPHATFEEVITIYELVRRCDRRDIPIVISTSRAVYTNLKMGGLIEKLSEAGITIIKDTCPVVSPAFHSRFKRVATVSGKAYFYLPRQQSQPTILFPISKLEEVLCKKR